jgi:hypothetical protein
MKYQLASLGVLVLAFLFHGLFPIVDHNPTPHAELQQLQTRGITHRFLLRILDDDHIAGGGGDEKVSGNLLCACNLLGKYRLGA